jgi:membrane associated rhomboid family serine protease
MFFPIGDTQVEGGHKPYFAYGFIALNIFIYAIQMMVEGNLVCEFSVIPEEIRQGDRLHTIFSSMFMHGGWMHIIGNMLFLWVFADNIEATVGSLRFVIFYLLGGVIASLAHVMIDGQPIGDMVNCCVPCSGCATENSTLCNNYIPSLGASGAISAVMGAYMVMFPKSKIKVIVLIIFSTFFINAWIFLALWFGQQLLSGVGGFGTSSVVSSSVAWWAHIGGFVFGLLAGLYFKNFVQDKRGPLDVDEYV